MASWMGIIEIVMSYRMMKMWSTAHTWWLVIMLLNAGMAIALLQSQLFINDDAWATRMIEHHSTAITTSRKLCEHCNRNETLCELACLIVESQLNEISTMKIHANYNLVTIVSSSVAIALALPMIVFSYFAI